VVVRLEVASVFLTGAEGVLFILADVGGAALATAASIIGTATADRAGAGAGEPLPGLNDRVAAVWFTCYAAAALTVLAVTDGARLATT
jgi:hypothetical protein